MSVPVRTPVVAGCCNASAEVQTKLLQTPNFLLNGAYLRSIAMSNDRTFSFPKSSGPCDGAIVWLACGLEVCSTRAVPTNVVMVRQEAIVFASLDCGAIRSTISTRGQVSNATAATLAQSVSR